MISYPIYYRVEIFLSIVKSPISDFLREGKFWRKKKMEDIFRMTALANVAIKSYEHLTTHKTCTKISIIKVIFLE